jgi:TonB-dependent SusC/RagA subfamily outer membrane receptor
MAADGAHRANRHGGEASRRQAAISTGTAPRPDLATEAFMRAPRPSPLLALLIIFVPAVAGAQTRTVHGRVVPGDPETPFTGAEVSLIGGSTSVCVDGNGDFALEVPAAEARLRITPVGFAPQEVVIAPGSANVEVGLGEHVIVLDGVEVVGYAASLRPSYGAAAIATVEAKDLGPVQATTIEEAMQGKVVGAMILRNSAAPGGSYSISLRGFNTILGSSDPVVVVDGTVLSNARITTGFGLVTGAPGEDQSSSRFANLHPGDIERIELLRGAAAAAQYGSRASNGVIVVTTKRGTRPAPNHRNTAVRCFLAR